MSRELEWYFGLYKSESMYWPVMNVGRLEELRTRIQTLATSIVLAALAKPGYGSYGYITTHSECSKLTEGFRENLKNDLSMEVQQRQEREYHQRSYKTFPRPPATWQPAIGPLLENLQELAKACKECKKNVEASQLDTFGLSLAGNDLRQVAMLPEWYWGLKLTSWGARRTRVRTAYIPVDQTVDTIAPGLQKSVERGWERTRAFQKPSNETIFENHGSQRTGQLICRGGRWTGGNAKRQGIWCGSPLLSLLEFREEIISGFWHFRICI